MRERLESTNGLDTLVDHGSKRKGLSTGSERNTELNLFTMGDDPVFTESMLDDVFKTEFTAT